MAQDVSEEKERMNQRTEADLSKKDPTLPVCCPFPWEFRTHLTLSRQAMRHGNEPSKGAKIDAELLAEDSEELRRKGKA